MKKIVLVLGALLAGAACWAADAAPAKEDYSWVRGVCYQPSADRAEQTARELGYGRRLGLNTCRFWLAPWDWKRNPAKYEKWLRETVRLAHANGYRSMPVLFNGNGLRPDYLLNEQNWPDLAAYAQALVAVLKDEPGLLMWDVMNEPECNPWVEQAPANEQKARRARIQAFVRKACALVKAADPTRPITVGSTTSWESEAIADCVDVLSFHDYSGTRQQIEDNFANAERIGKARGIPVLQTETGCLARCNPYDLALAACQRHKMGWVVYCLMIPGRCDSEHGIFYADGTVRDPATVAAIMGCHRNRNLATIIPGLANREGHAERCVDEIRRALAEKTDDAFDYRPANVARLLAACERAANLLECCDLVPMAVPPTAKIAAWRQMERPPLAEIRAFAYDLAKTLRDACQLL